jgi:ribonuclease E
VTEVSDNASVVDQAPAAELTPPGDATPPVDPQPLADAGPAKKPTRKRAARKKVAEQPPDLADTTDRPGISGAIGGDAHLTDSTSGAATESTPAKKATRKRASRAKKAAPAQHPDAADVTTADPAGAELDSVDPTIADPTIADPTIADPTVPDPDADDSEQPSGGLPLGVGAVLFQAPDPVAPLRRSRRAQSPAGPPAPAGGPQDSPTGSEPADRSGGRQPKDGAGSDEAKDGAGSDEAKDGAEAALADDPDSGDSETAGGRKRRRRGGRGRRGRSGEADQDGESDKAGDPAVGQLDQAAGPDAALADESAEPADDGDSSASSSRRRRRRRRRTGGEDGAGTASSRAVDEVASVKGSTRLEAKKQRRRDGRDAGRRKPTITEAEFLARRESVERRMVVREQSGRIQIAVLEDDVLVEHYVANETNASMIGNVYLGRVQNVLPSMEAAFIDIGKGRNAVLYAGEVNWDAAGLDGQPRRIEVALKSGDQVLVQVTKDPMGHKGARLTSQISLPGRYLVYVPRGSMTGISRKLPDNERTRLKKILKAVVPEGAGVIVRTAAEGASEAELGRDVERLTALWEEIERKSTSSSGGSAPKLVHGEPDLTVRVIRDVFNEDFAALVVSGSSAWDVVHPYVTAVAPDLADRVSRWTAPEDVFAAHRVDEQLAKAMDRKVWLPSGGSLVIDRTEAMTVVDVNTGKFTGAGGNLEQTVTRNNLESAEEIVRQLRLRDIGGIIVIDFIDMVLESNRDLVLRRLLECLGRDRTKHQVAEVTSLGLVQMTRKRVGQGLIEVFSEPCEHCNGRGILIQSEPVGKNGAGSGGSGSASPAKAEGGSGRSRGRGRGKAEPAPEPSPPPRQPIPAGLVASLSQPHDPSEPGGQPRADQPDAGAGSSAPARPAVETPAVGAPAVEAPAVEAPAVEAPAVEAPAVEVSTGADQDGPEPRPLADEAAVASKPRRRRRATSPAGPPAGQNDPAS